ncbi:MAG: hypothetical protein HC872_04070 [Gammaproteobacteria bacterium]|nr:hypothetical protein [Gammaproteobacteria bacterium]
MGAPLSIAYLNGVFLPLREARVSPLDRAFLYGDAVYEVMPVYAGRVFRFTEHFARLDRSLQEIRMAPPYPRERWAQVCQELVRRNGGGDMYIYVQVTRGAEYGRNHAPLPEIERTVFAFAAEPVISAPEKIEHGVKAITAPDNRWARCDVKSTALLANVLLKQLAVDADAHETLLLQDGQLREGSSTTCTWSSMVEFARRHARHRSCRAPPVTSSPSSPPQDNSAKQQPSSSALSASQTAQKSTEKPGDPAAPRERPAVARDSHRSKWQTRRINLRPMPPRNQSRPNLIRHNRNNRRHATRSRLVRTVCRARAAKWPVVVRRIRRPRASRATTSCRSGCWTCRSPLRTPANG